MSRKSQIQHRHITAVGIGLLSLSLAGCLEHPVKKTYVDNSSEEIIIIDLVQNRKVDVLMVIDNSGSMGEEQANLAANFGSFIDELEAVGADYRLAVTTTDNGNPMCSGSTPEGGKFVASSCLDRISHFVSQVGVDVSDIACEDICEMTGSDLQLEPSKVDDDSQSRARPWLQSNNGITNLPAGIGTVEAFQCLAPQGVDGCGFESPLESMHKALTGTFIDSENRSGFIREDAILAVIIVTDEVDCSYRGEASSIFTDDGNKAFWDDPGDAWATSAVCWNAGVECAGAGGMYENCEAVDHDIDGNITDDPDAAVLHPVSRYIESLEDLRHIGDQPKPIIVGVISGVPDGYADNQADITFQDSQDDGYQHEYGIGPGCSSVINGEPQDAVPPVRLREFAEAFDHVGAETRNLYSVCSGDYTPALSDITGRLLEEIKPVCFPGCARDVDLVSEGVQVGCTITEQAPDEDAHDVPECALIDGEWEMPSEDDDVCFVARTDDSFEFEETPYGMHEECAAKTNLEFQVLRRKGTAEVPGTAVTARCENADLTQSACD